MSLFWKRLEELGQGRHVIGDWNENAGSEESGVKNTFLKNSTEYTRWLSCPLGCGCRHEVFKRDANQMVAVCRCVPRGCNDLLVKPQGIELLEFNATKFGRAVARAFECDARERPTAQPMTWQIGAKFTTSVSVFLTIQSNQESFSKVVAELVARQRQPFILLTPTSRWLDAPNREMLALVQATAFDLETNLILLPSGLLKAIKSGGELFAAYRPHATEQSSEDVARAAWAVVSRLDSGKSRCEPSAIRVFKHYCKEGISADKLAVKYGWAKGTVMNRLKEIESATGVKKERLRDMSGHFSRMEDEMTDSRASSINRKVQIE